MNPADIATEDIVYEFLDYRRVPEEQKIGPGPGLIVLEDARGYVMTIGSAAGFIHFNIDEQPEITVESAGPEGPHAFYFPEGKIVAQKLTPEVFREEYYPFFHPQHADNEGEVFHAALWAGLAQDIMGGNG